MTLTLGIERLPRTTARGRDGIHAVSSFATQLGSFARTSAVPIGQKASPERTYTGAAQYAPHER